MPQSRRLRRVLLTSVFGPFACDDEFGSRAINPLELYHNQVVKGEGIRWFREFLGEPVDQPIEHPVIVSSFGFRLMGLKAPDGGGDPAATIIPSLGPVLLWSARRESLAYPEGRPLEPQTFVERRNWA